MGRVALRDPTGAWELAVILVLAVPGPWESAGGLAGISVVVCVTHPHEGKIGPHMSWCHARVWAAAGQRSLGRAGTSSLRMLESLRSLGREGTLPGPGGQIGMKVM